MVFDMTGPFQNPQLPEQAVFMMKVIANKARHACVEFDIWEAGPWLDEIGVLFRDRVGDEGECDRQAACEMCRAYDRLSDVFLDISTNLDAPDAPYRMFRRIGSGLYEMKILIEKFIAEGNGTE